MVCHGVDNRTSLYLDNHSERSIPTQVSSISQVGATLQTSSFSRSQLLVARFITGIGTGIETTTVPVYQSELCEAKKRGKYVSSEPLFVGVGIVIAYWFDYGMSYVPGPINWRLPIACQMGFAVLVVLLVFG